MTIRKEDFQVYDKHLGNDGGAYKKLGEGTWYNDEMYQEALLKAKNGVGKYDVSILAKFCKKISKQKDCPSEFIEIVNREFWKLI